MLYRSGACASLRYGEGVKQVDSCCGVVHILCRAAVMSHLTPSPRKAIRELLIITGTRVQYCTVQYCTRNHIS